MRRTSRQRPGISLEVQIDYSLAALTDWLSEIDPYQPVDRADFNRRLQTLSQSSKALPPSMLIAWPLTISPA